MGVVAVWMTIGYFLRVLCLHRTSEGYGVGVSTMAGPRQIYDNMCATWLQHNGTTSLTLLM